MDAALVKAAQEKLGWAAFNLGKGKTEAALILIDKAYKLLDEALVEKNSPENLKVSKQVLGGEYH